MDMNVTSWKPPEFPYHKKDVNDCGTVDAEVYTHIGMVSVFSFPGDDECEEFTSIRMWLHPKLYHVNLPKYYKPRWIARLAREFAHQCEYENGQG